MKHEIAPFGVSKHLPKNYRHPLEKGDLIQRVANLIYVT
jgi:hypothetical protein